MEAIQATSACSRACAIGAAVVVDSAASGTQSLGRAFLTRKPLSCQGLSTSSTSFCHNALAREVGQAGSGSKGHRAVVTMRSDTAAGGYANALAEIANSNGCLDEINKDVEALGDILKNPEVHEFLVSPVVRDEKKKSILKTLADDAKFNTYTLNFLYILVDKKRFGLIKDVVKEFATIYFELTDTQLATVASAVKIEKAQLALIAKKIQSLSGAKNVRIKNVIDPSLIAGFIVKYGKDGSRSVDMSVKGQLDRLAHQFEYAEKVGVA